MRGSLQSVPNGMLRCSNLTKSDTRQQADAANQTARELVQKLPKELMPTRRGHHGAKC
jgi:hypothetical protein